MSASKSLRGGEIGVEGVWAPWSHLPLVLEAGIAASRLTAVRREIIVDGYTPFEDGIRATRFRIGVAWRARGADLCAWRTSIATAFPNALPEASQQQLTSRAMRSVPVMRQE